jgi:LPS sulfotransferase NodH
MDDDDGKYLGTVIAAATTPNGVFGAKVHWDQFMTLVAKAKRLAGAQSAEVPARMPEILRSALPGLRYIWLTRRNEVARAISHYRAKKTDRWHVDSRWLTDDADGAGEPGFDFDQIDAFVRAAKSDELRWRQYFQEHEIVPLELSYEDLVRDLEGAVRRVLEFVGSPVEEVRLPPPTLRKLADTRSKEWEARYRQICAEESR